MFDLSPYSLLTKKPYPGGLPGRGYTEVWEVIMELGKSYSVRVGGNKANN